MVVMDNRKVLKLGYSSLCWVLPYTCKPIMAKTTRNSRMRLEMARKEAAEDRST